MMSENYLNLLVSFCKLTKMVIMNELTILITK